MTLHNAPPVVYPLGRSRFQGLLFLGIWLLGLLVCVLWFAATRQPDWRMAVALAAVLVAGTAAYSAWSNTPVGQLRWDGKVWCWESLSYQTGAAEYELTVIADAQHVLLLRLENPARARLWLWAERKASPERWLDLRRAVYSPHKSHSTSQHTDLPSSETPAAVAVSDSMHAVDVARTTP